MEDNPLCEILDEMIREIYDTEHCGGKWREGCENIFSERCATCCRGINLLQKLMFYSEGRKEVKE